MVIKSVNGDEIHIDEDGKVTKKKTSFFERAKIKTKETVEWCKQHPEETVAILTVTVTGIGTITKFINKQYTLHEMKTLKERSIYDRSNGHYHIMKRVPTTNQWLEIDRRKRAGEAIGVILKDMRLI